LTDNYATVVAQHNAEERTVQEIGDDILTRLQLYATGLGDFRAEVRDGRVVITVFLLLPFNQHCLPSRALCHTQMGISNIRV
jgi:hypothetical protein